MSLPGLQVSEPAEIVKSPVVHDLKAETEWRFEVAFGSKIEVKVRCCLILLTQNRTFTDSSFSNGCFPEMRSFSALSLLKNRHICS